MLIKNLIKNLDITLKRSQFSRDNITCEISDITDDSRQVAFGSLFIARTRPNQSNLTYIDDAIQCGARAILCSETDLAQWQTQTTTKLASDQSINDHLTNQAKILWLTASKVDQVLAGQLAERFFKHPSQQLKMIGITGTNGKTTTAYLIAHLLRENQVLCGLIGTITIDDGRANYPATLTTPGAIELSRLLATMVKNGCQAVVLEVSSHSLDQGRVQALDFHVGIFTNLTGDHLDYHTTMDDYAEAKAKLFRKLPPNAWAIINADDSFATQMIANSRARRLACHLINASDGNGNDNSNDGNNDNSSNIHTHPNNGHCQATILSLERHGSCAIYTGPWGSVELQSKLVGRHNIANLLQAIAAANIITPLANQLDRVIKTLPAVPGRLELVTLPDKVNRQTHHPAVIVDYAHTHDALENVLLSLKQTCQAKLIVLFGCGGDRDKTKRPKMAKIASKLADVVYVTSDNPRTEDPEAIIKEIKTGFTKSQLNKVHIQADREAAIHLAVSNAAQTDTILIAGKGHEDYQIIGTKKHPFDDRNVAREALRQWIQQNTTFAN